MTAETQQPESMDEIRDRLVEAALPHVPFTGWGEATLDAAAAEASIEPRVARRAFPRPAIGMVVRFSAVADRRMEAELAEYDLSAMRFRDRIALAVRLRLGQNVEQREAVRLAFGVLAMPPYAFEALRCLYRTVDRIWFGVGDESTDFSFYTKRLLLAGVYLSTQLCWIADESEDFAGTWAFLERRLEEVMRLGKVRGRIREILANRPTLLGILRRGVAGFAPRKPKPDSG